ncbi:S26 family signal peptidase [Fusobacterium sp. PH5-44]|uniref:S26 family signal peptidase n=1 Tax=unclassified Fusobacterium TaxID=2648384 RepID=UPI003D19406D
MMKINKKPTVIFSTIIIFFFILQRIGRNYTINISNSLPRGLYKLESPQNLKKEDIIFFPIPNNIRELLRERKYISPVINSFMKKVGAEYGDKIQIKNNILYVNETAWGLMFTKDPRNNILPILTIDELTPGYDEILPLSSALYSFDGRYFGPIKRQEIKYKCILIFEF